MCCVFIYICVWFFVFYWECILFDFWFFSSVRRTLHKNCIESFLFGLVVAFSCSFTYFPCWFGWIVVLVFFFPSHSVFRSQTSSIACNLFVNKFAVQSSWIPGQRPSWLSGDRFVFITYSITITFNAFIHAQYTHNYNVWLYFIR